jgi:hypothetical protein
MWIMNTQIIIAAALAVVLVVGIVSATAPAFADNNSVKIKQSNKINNHGGSTVASQSNDACGFVNSEVGFGC